MEAAHQRVVELEEAAALASAEAEAANNTAVQLVAESAATVAGLQAGLATATEAQSSAESASSAAAEQLRALEEELEVVRAGAASGAEEAAMKLHASEDALTMVQCSVAEMDTFRARVEELEANLLQSTAVAESASAAAMAAESESQAAAAAASEQVTELESRITSLQSELESLVQQQSDALTPTRRSSDGFTTGESLQTLVEVSGLDAEALAAAVIERDAVVEEYGDAKRKFVQMTEKRQQDHASKVCAEYQLSYVVVVVSF